MLVQPQQAATVCELDLLQHGTPSGHRNGLKLRIRTVQASPRKSRLLLTAHWACSPQVRTRGRYWEKPRRTRDTGVCQEGGAWFAVRIVAAQTFGQRLAGSVARESIAGKAI